MISEKHNIASRKNLLKAIEARHKAGTTIMNCEYCGRECLVHMARVRKGWRYCSWECRRKAMVGDNAPNAGGGEWMRGENNINYRHGKSAETLHRNLTLVNQWRRRVFARDNYVCQRCGYDKGHILKAHHIHLWSKFLELRYELSNGITLCDDCHKWVHGKENINQEYIIKCK